MIKRMAGGRLRNYKNSESPDGIQMELATHFFVSEVPSADRMSEGHSRNYNSKGIFHVNIRKTIVLLREMPEQSLESLYDFIRSIWIYQDIKTENPENSIDISESIEGFRVLQSFAGTLPADFDYKTLFSEKCSHCIKSGVKCIFLHLITEAVVT